MNIETVVLKALTSSDSYARKVTPYLKKDYFTDKAHQALYLISDSYFKKYNQCASKEVLLVELDKLKGLNEQLFSQALETVEQVENQPLNSDEQWLVDTTEEFCKDRALHLAFAKALEIYKGNEQRLSRTAIPKLMEEALGVAFDERLGHDYIDSAEEQLEYYHSDVERIATDIQIFNDITNGGIPRKTLSLFIAGTHVGKSLTMCALAGGCYMLGYNVLYITLEESEPKIRQRIDANLLNITMDDLLYVDKNIYRKRMKQIEQRTTGKLKIREFPTAGASTSQFRYLLNELKLKKNFVPDIVFVDYLNICKSDRHTSIDNSNAYVKSITEELRGLAIESNAAFVSGTQLNRVGMKDSDPDMDDVAESFGSMFVADFVTVLTAPDELRAKNMMMWKQQKNRYRNLHFKKRFVTGADPLKMRVYDVEESAQPTQDIDTPVFDTSNTANRLKAERFETFIYDDEDV